MAIVIGTFGNRLPDLNLTNAKRNQLRSKVTEYLPPDGIRLNPHVFVVFESGGLRCAVWITRAGTDFPTLYIEEGEENFDALVRA